MTQAGLPEVDSSLGSDHALSADAWVTQLLLDTRLQARVAGHEERGRRWQAARQLLAHEGVCIEAAAGLSGLLSGLCVCLLGPTLLWAMPWLCRLLLGVPRVEAAAMLLTPLIGLHRCLLSPALPCSMWLCGGRLLLGIACINAAARLLAPVTGLHWRLLRPALLCSTWLCRGLLPLGIARIEAAAGLLAPLRWCLLTLALLLWDVWPLSTALLLAWECAEELDSVELCPRVVLERLLLLPWWRLLLPRL